VSARPARRVQVGLSGLRRSEHGHGRQLTLATYHARAGGIQAAGQATPASRRRRHEEIIVGDVGTIALLRSFVQVSG
jgi:hypothetical protein